MEFYGNRKKILSKQYGNVSIPNEMEFYRKKPWNLVECSPVSIPNEMEFYTTIDEPFSLEPATVSIPNEMEFYRID